MPLPTIRHIKFRGSMLWEVDARTLREACKARGIPVRRKFPTRRAADDWAGEILARIEREPETRIAVHELCDHFLCSREIHVRPDTMRSYRTATRRLRAFCTASGIRCTDELTPAIVGEYSDGLYASLKKASAALYLTIASTCFAWAVERGYVDRNPFVGVARRPHGSPRRILTDEERATILSETQHTDLWLFMLGTGTRVIEVCRIESKDVRIDSPAPHVQLLGKGDKERTVPIGPEVGAAARRLLHAGDGRIWPDGRRKHLQTLWRKERDRLKLPKDITLHVFRHDFASWLVNVEQLPLPDVQRVLGHANLATTAIYLHPDGRRLGAATKGRSAALKRQQSGNSERKAL